MHLLVVSVACNPGYPLAVEPEVIRVPSLSLRVRRKQNRTLPTPRVPSPENVVGLRELDLLVGDDLDSIALRVAEFEAAGRKSIDIQFLQAALDSIEIVDNEPEVAVAVASVDIPF